MSQEPSVAPTKIPGYPQRRRGPKRRRRPHGSCNVRYLVDVQWRNHHPRMGKAHRDSQIQQTTSNKHMFGSFGGHSMKPTSSFSESVLGFSKIYGLHRTCQAGKFPIEADWQWLSWDNTSANMQARKTMKGRKIHNASIRIVNASIRIYMVYTHLYASIICIYMHPASICI